MFGILSAETVLVWCLNVVLGLDRRSHKDDKFLQRDCINQKLLVLLDVCVDFMSRFNLVDLESSQLTEVNFF